MLFIIKSGFKSRVGYNSGNTVYKNLDQVHNIEVGLLHCIIYIQFNVEKFTKAPLSIQKFKVFVLSKSSVKKNRYLSKVRAPLSSD